MSWQSNTFDLKEKMRYLMESKEFHDVKLNVGFKQQPILAHKLFLSMYSEVFQSMFYSFERTSGYEISLLDDDPDIFNIFLNFIYMDKVKLNSLQEALNVLKFAEKYKVKNLKTICNNYVINNTALDVNSVLPLYESATERNIELKNKCWEFIKNNASKIMKSHAFLLAKYETVLAVASEECLKLESEVNMYDAIIRWGEAHIVNSNRAMLSNAIFRLYNEVRFMSMTLYEFASASRNDEFLPRKDRMELERLFYTLTPANSEKDLVEQKECNLQVRCSKLYYFPSNCKYNSKKSLHFLKITERICSNYYSLYIWGVHIKINFNWRKYSTKAKFEVDLKVCNMTKNIENSRKCSFFLPSAEEKLKDVEAIPIYLRSPVLVMKNEKCDITLSNSFLDYRGIFTYCDSSCQFFDKLQRNSLTRTHFAAIIASIKSF